MTELVKKRRVYKPFSHPYLFEAYKKQTQMFWMPEKIGLQDDPIDMKKLRPKESDMIKNILRFFTQGDIEVANAYMNLYPKSFPIPEANMCFAAFANMESIHIEAYALLNETLGMPDSDFSKFLEHKEMMDKIDILDQAVEEGDILTNLGVFAGFLEGVCLFSSFAILLSFSAIRKEKKMMRGVGQVVSYSVRDESLHVETMTRLFKDTVETLEPSERAKVIAKVLEKGQELVDAEMSFIDLLYESGECDIDKEDLKQFIRFVADYRIYQLGISTTNEPLTNPLPWFFDLCGVDHTSFFESKVTSYAMVEDKSSWNDAFEGI